MKLNRLSKVAIGVAAACGVYSAIGFWGVPAGLKWAASSPVSDILGRKVSIQEVKFNPWTLELSAKGVEMAGRDASDQPVSIGSLYTNMAGFSSLTRFGVVLDELKVDHVSGLLSIDENGKTNFQDIIDNINRRFPPTEEKSKEPFRFSLNNISLTNSDFHIVVPSHHVDEKLTEINLGLPFIGSIGTDRDIYVKPELTLKDNGTPFELHGESLPFKNTKATRVHLALDGYDLPHLGAMLPLDMDVTSGTLKLNADITFAQGVDGGKNTILVDFTGNADDFAAAMRGSEAKTNAIAFKSLKIDQGSVDVIGRTATVNGITLESPTIALERLADGSIAWAKVAGTSDKAEPPKTDDAKADEKKPEDTTPAFAWTVKNAAITDGTLRFIDHAAHDARIDASALNATAENVTMIPGQTTNFDLSAKILDGSLKTNGSLDISALKGKASVDAQNLNLDRISGYAELAGLTIASRATAKVDAEYSLMEEKPSVSAGGTLNLKNFALTKKGESPLSVKADNARAESFKALYDGDVSLDLGKLALAKPAVELPKSSFSAGFGGIDAQNFSLGWKGKDEALSLGARTLALATPEIHAGSFSGKAGRLSGNTVKVGWNGKQDTVTFDGGKVRAEKTDLTAGSFKSTITDSNAAKLAVNWNGKKELLGVTSQTTGLAGLDFKADPVTGGSTAVNAQALSLSVATREDGGVSVKAADVNSKGTRLQVAGGTPVKLAVGTLDVKKSALDIKKALAFTGSSVSAGDIQSTVDLLNFNTGHADINSISFTRDSDMSLKVASANLSKAQVISPVNAAKVSTLSDTVSASNLDWKSGASGHANLASLNINSTAFEISGGKSKFGRVDRTTVTGVEAPATGTIRVSAVEIAKPRMMLSRDAKGNLDIDPLLGKRKAATEAKKVQAVVKQKVEEAKKKAGVSASQPIRIGEFRVTDGGFSFVDNSIKPAGQFRFADLNTTVKPVAIGGENTPSSLTMTGVVNGVSKINVTGSGSPFVDKGKLTAKGTISAVSMPFFSPYTVHYVSYPIQKGNLTIKSDITLKDKTFLDVDNHILIEQLAWGDYIPNDTSTSLPVTLATALLTDGQGNIEFDLPISGNLADPEFSFSSLILTGLENLIIKVVAAPVNLLASIGNLALGGSSSSAAAFVPYMSGSGHMTADQQKSTLAQITKALKDNPKMKVEITPVVSVKGDDNALHQNTYRGLLKIVQSTLPEAERSREKAVDALYALQFPNDKASHTLEEKEAKLYTAVQPDESNLHNLADWRSRNLSKALAEAGIADKRIFITAPDMDKKGNLGGVKIKFIK